MVGIPLLTAAQNIVKYLMEQSHWLKVATVSFWYIIREEEWMDD